MDHISLARSLEIHEHELVAHKYGALSYFFIRRLQSLPRASLLLLVVATLLHG